MATSSFPCGHVGIVMCLHVSGAEEPAAEEGGGVPLTGTAPPAGGPPGPRALLPHHALLSQPGDRTRGRLRASLTLGRSPSHGPRGPGHGPLAPRTTELPRGGYWTENISFPNFFRSAKCFRTTFPVVGVLAHQVWLTLA